MGLDIERLEGDLDEVEVEVFQYADLPESGGDHVVDDRVLFVLTGSLGQKVDAVSVPRQAACLADSSDGRKAAEVDPDADRHTARLGLADDRLYLLAVANVARVQPETVNACLQRPQRKLIMEVDVGDQRNVDLPPDIPRGRRPPPCRGRRRG